PGFRCARYPGRGPAFGARCADEECVTEMTVQPTRKTATVGEARPATAAQRSIYFGHSLDERGDLYNTGVYTESRGAVDRARLLEAVTTVVRAAEPLHVNFAVDDDGTLVQVPRDAGAWSPEVLDLRGAADPDAQSLAWMRERMARPLDLGRDELTTFAVHRLA